MIKGKKIRTPSDAVQLLRNKRKVSAHTMLAIHLTRSMTVSRVQSVDDNGSADSQILREAVNRKTEGLIVARNQSHLDISKPNKEEDGFAKELLKMGRLLGICVLDHILLGKNNRYSYKESGRVFARGSVYSIRPCRKEYRLVCG